jgi:hypothetical protein
MIKKKNRQLADTVVMLAFLFLFTAVANVEIAKIQSMNAVLGSNVSDPWTTPVLNSESIPLYGCKRKYNQPPSWVCDWNGKHGKMQTHIYITQNLGIEYPAYEEWANENNELPNVQTGK